MSQYLDSSVLVASPMPDDPDYAPCDTLLNQAGNWTTPHALTEVFATLTGGELGIDLREQCAGGIGLAALDGVEEERDVGHGRE